MDSTPAHRAHPSGGHWAWSLLLCGLLAGCFTDLDEVRERARRSSEPDAGLDVIAPADTGQPRPDAGPAPDAAQDGGAGPDTDGAIDGASDADADAADAVFDAPAPPVAFGEVTALFERRCAPCHIDDASGGLSLRSNDALPAVLADAATQLPTMPRIEPGVPESSYLWLKVSGLHTDAGGLGEAMPLGASLDANSLRLLRRWIEQGAPGIGADDVGAP